MACLYVACLGWNDQADRAAILQWHNTYRCMHGVPLLQWDDTIAAHAQNWANQCRGNMQHSSQQQRRNIAGFRSLGENLAWASPSIDGKQAAQMWYDEIKSTNNGRVSSFGMGTGHYTQVVWRGTTSFGCGHSSGLVVCQYGEAGNMQGSFNSNVNSPVKREEQCRSAGGNTGGGHARPPAQGGRGGQRVRPGATVTVHRSNGGSCTKLRDSMDGHTQDGKFCFRDGTHVKVVGIGATARSGMWAEIEGESRSGWTNGWIRFDNLKEGVDGSEL